jgi:CRISPR system Cascade subunit CasD
MLERRWLILRLEGPLLAFGGVAIDQIGVTRDFPAAAMLTGLLANALGLDRTDWHKLQTLQDRLVFAARRDRDEPGSLLTDVQNAQLSKADQGWTTFGDVEERAGASYEGPHRRKRDHHMDGAIVVAMTVEPAEEEPTLDRLAAALDRPVRPLFIGRKHCLPARPLLDSVGRIVVAPNAYAALAASPPGRFGASMASRAQWPLGEGPGEGEHVDRIFDLADIRNWRSGLHGGTRRIVEGRIAPETPRSAQ